MSEKTVFREKNADDSPGFLLFRITVLWQKKLGIIFNDLKIQQTQYAILASLKYFEEKNEKCTQAFLVEHARIDKMTLSKSVRQLEKTGLVKRAQSDEDARAVLVQLTQRGRNLVTEAVRRIEDADELFFHYLNEKQRSSFKEISLALIKGNSES